MKKNKKVTSRIEKLCSENGVKFTHQRRIIAIILLWCVNFTPFSEQSFSILEVTFLFFFIFLLSMLYILHYGHEKERKNIIRYYK